MKGFVDYKVDYVIKFGGSLLEDFDSCKRAVKVIEMLKETGLNFLIIPGGGPTDNTIETLDKTAHFVPDTHHRACARAQDQTGLMLCDSAFGKKFVPCEKFEEVNNAINNNLIPVLLPSYTIFAIDPFEKTWEITSDAMAAWYCWLIHGRELIILTNIDGVYPPDKINECDQLIKKITAYDLCKLGHTAVDSCTAPFLMENRINAWVVNGKHPERLLSIVNGDDCIATRIYN